MWIKYLFISVLIFTSTFSFSQEEKARRIVETLCSDSLYGRGYLKDGMAKAANFMKDEFKESGLLPFFDDSYFQEFKMNVNIFPDTIEVKVDGKTLTPGVDYLVDNISGSFKGVLNPVVITGLDLEDPDLFNAKIDEIIKGDKNSLFVDIRGLTELEDKNLKIYNEMGAYFSPHFPVVYFTDQKLTWSVAIRRNEYPIIHIKNDDITVDAEIELNIKSELINNFAANNVAGYIPSKKKNAKTIVFTAHYDHLGGMGTVPSTYFPGGNDNASGTSMLVALADHYKENPSKYNILFIAFAAEEAGLIGSKYFVDSDFMNLKDIKFLINLDIMGSGEEGITAVNGRVFPKHFEKLQKVNEKGEYLSEIKSRGAAANSDHYWFYEAGVPCFFFYTMGPNKHYHDVYDTYEELSFSAYNNIVKLLIAFVDVL